MSIGNLNTEGNKKNNFPYQLAVLKLLDAILQATGGGGGGGCPCPSSNQEATQLLIQALLTSIDSNTTSSDTTLSNILTALSPITPMSVTPGLLRVTAAGSVAAGARSVSVYNAGAANGLVLGTIIKPGESLSWSAGAMNNTLTIVSYDGTGTELVIATTV